MAGSYKNSGLGKLEERAKVALRTVKELFGALRSSDGPTRRAARLFVLGVFGVLAVLIFSVIHLRARFNPVHIKTVEEQQAEIMKEILEKEKSSKEQHVTIYRVGSFGMQLKDVEGSRPLRGVVGMAELEIHVQCDRPETCLYLDEHSTDLKDIIAPMLNPMDREILMSVDGKEKLKIALQDKVNRWLPRGHIDKIFFSRLLID